MRNERRTSGSVKGTRKPLGVSRGWRRVPIQLTNTESVLTMKLVLEASVWKFKTRHMARMQPEPGRLGIPTGWGRSGLVVASAPNRAATRAARGKANHLPHQGWIL